MRMGPRATSGREAGLLHASPLAFGLLLAAIIGAGSLARFHRLDAQSFWHDEGNSARIAERPVDLILEGAAGDIHPPGYYLLLHGWRGLFGQSEFALRSLSVVAGLVMVMVTGLLGRWLFGPVVGLTAATLSAISPLAVYYSQEARMYALLGALSAASAYVSLRTWSALERGFRLRSQNQASAPTVRWLVAYALVNAAGLYTHYAYLFVLIAHNLGFGLTWTIRWLRRERSWQGLLPWAAANLGVVLLYTPWLPVARRAAGWSPAGRGPAAASALLDVLRVLTVGVTQSSGDAGIAMASSAALLAVSLWPRAKMQRGAANGLPRWLRIASMTVYLVVPLCLFFGLSLYKPAWLKFLIVLLPPYHVLVAHGVRRVAGLVLAALRVNAAWQKLAVPVASAILIAAMGASVYPSLRNLYSNPVYARDDYRQLAADIEAMWRPGDAVVLSAPNQWEVFTYYYPDQHVYPAPYRPQPGRATAFLESLVAEYDRLFVIYWGDAESDPRKRIESWLARHAYKAGDRWYGDVRLASYGVFPLPQQPAVTLDAQFGEHMLLQGYSRAEGARAPGELVWVTLFWRASGAIARPYKVTVQMLDRDGRLVSQVDTIPDDGLAPTTGWGTDASLADRYGVLVPQNASPGRYTLIVAVYDAATGERAPVLFRQRRSDYVSLGDVTVR